MLDHYIYQRSIKRERKRSTRVTVTNKTTLKLRNRAVFECLLLVYVRTYVRHIYVKSSTIFLNFYSILAVSIKFPFVVVGVEVLTSLS